MTEKNLAKQDQKAIIVDDGAFANFMDSARFDHLWRIATLFAKSELVPKQFQGKPENCMISIEMAMRMDVAILPFLQNSYIVHGKPGIEAKLAITLINSSGLFVDSLDYEVVGEDAHRKDYKVRAFAVRKSSGKTVYGPWVEWGMVEKEGWLSKEGSKWKTMPAIMFAYRAATFFGRLHCPERLLGMQTVDELVDVGPRGMVDVTPPAETLEAQVGLKPQAKPEPKPRAKAASKAPDPEPKPQPEQNQQAPFDTASPMDALLETLGHICGGVEGEMNALLTIIAKRKMTVDDIRGMFDAEAVDLLADLKAYLDKEGR
jgi:hypothetical protein